MNTPFVLTNESYRRTLRVAHHYGFSPFDELCPPQVKNKKRLTRLSGDLKNIDSVNGEMARTLKTCLEYDLPQEPPLLFYHHNIHRSKHSPENTNFGLQVVGTRASAAEAVILKTATAILNEAGVNNNTIYINSIGDYDSSLRYYRELSNYFRKHINELSPQGQVALKQSPYNAYRYAQRKQEELCRLAPKPLDFLSRDSRKHFREVLEYLESTDIPYMIDDSLIRDNNCYTQTIFEIRSEPTEDEQEGAVVAQGGRYDGLAQRLWGIASPAVGLIFSLIKKGKEKITAPRIQKKLKACLVHLGPDAEKKTLTVIEILRQAKVPVTQSIGGVAFVDQLKYAEKLSVPYTLIIGQKEALEDTCIVRDMETRAQQVIPIQELADYIK